MPLFVSPRACELGSCLLALLVVGCRFDADYGDGGFACDDGRCPSGLVCDGETNRCVGTLRDSGLDSVDMADAPVVDMDMDVAHALTCADPGVIAATGGTATGSTVSRSSTISSMCGGTIMNGPDAVFRLTTTAANAQYLIATSALKAYVLADCTLTPATPACIGTMNATPGNPISVTLPAVGDYFIVADHDLPNTSGAFTLTVTAQ